MPSTPKLWDHMPEKDFVRNVLCLSTATWWPWGSKLLSSPVSLLSLKPLSSGNVNLHLYIASMAWFSVCGVQCILLLITIVFPPTSLFILKVYFVLFHCAALWGQHFDMMFLLDSLEEEFTVSCVKCNSCEWQQQPFLRNYTLLFFSFQQHLWDAFFWKA